MLIDIGGFPSSALDRQATRTCMHSVTDRDKTFKQRLSENGHALFDAVVSGITVNADNDGGFHRNSADCTLR